MNKNLLILCVVFGVNINCFSQAVWVQKASIPSTGSYSGASFGLNDKVYVVGGVGSNGLALSTTWEYDPSINVWSQKANYPAGTVVCAQAITLGNMGYVITGQVNGNYSNAVYAYYPSTNTWYPKSAFAGSARYTATAIEIGGLGYMGFGYNPLQNDWWAYNPNTDVWTQKASLPGSARQSAVGFSIGNKGYIGLGSYSTPPTYLPLNDLWEYDPAINSWNQKTSFPLSGRWACIAFAFNGSGYVGGGVSYTNGAGPSTYYADMWKYDPNLDAWTYLNNFPNNIYGTSQAVVSSGVFAGLGVNAGVYKTQWYQLTGLTAINNPDGSQKQFEIYPNPVTDVLNIKSLNFNGSDKTGVLEILDLTGKRVFIFNDLEISNNLKVNLPHLPAQGYICRLIGLSGKVIFQDNFIVAK